MKTKSQNHLMPPKMWIAFVFTLFLYYPFGLQASSFDSSNPYNMSSEKENDGAVWPVINGAAATEFDMDELSKIIQNCIDISQLQKYYKTDENSETVQVNVYYYHPLLFPITLDVNKGGKKLLFKELSSPIESISEDFFLFNSFIMTDKTASVSYNYYYYDGTVQKVVKVVLELQKVNDNWSVKDTTFNN